MKAVIYTRVSTDEQAESGAGRDAQLDAGNALCDRESITERVVIDDDISGGVPLEKRDTLCRAIALLEQGDILVVYKRDRIFRGDPLHMAMIEAAVRRKGARIVSTMGEGTNGDGPTDILMRRIVDAFGEYERLIIKTRTKAALQSRKSRGKKYCNSVYGKRPDNWGNLRTAPNEVAIINLILDLHRRGYSSRKIAKLLTRDQIPTPRQKPGRRLKPWQHTTVRNLIETHEKQSVHENSLG